MKRVRAFTLFFIAAALLATGCVKRVTVSEVLGINPPVSTEELINRLNSFATVDTFSAQTEVVVRNYFTGKNAKADEFPAANGQIRFQRPESIRMLVSAPFINSRIADMTSDGQQFRLAVHWPKEKQQFIYGTNLNQIERMAATEIEKNKDPQLSQAGGLLNMRPQHITDAFLIKAPSIDNKIEYFREEVRQDEPDPRKKGRTVTRSYYVLYIIEHNQGRAELRRKFWFDRNQSGTPLVRQQTFENGNGKLASDISYYDWFTVSGSNYQSPKRVLIDRRTDGYRLELILERDSVEINSPLPETTFVLENTEKYKEKNLDEPQSTDLKKASSLDQNRKQQRLIPVNQ